MDVKSQDPTSGAFRIPDLTALYSKPYDASMERWRQIGAVDKARHILDMVGARQSNVESILEVGCGTGAILLQFKLANFGTRLAGIEIGTSDRAEERIVSGIEMSGYNGVTIPFKDSEFDLVYATHVLEHVLHPRAFLLEMRRVSRRFVFLEVPCELHLRSSVASLQTTLDIGHFNSYTPEAFALSLETSGLTILSMKVYDHSYAVHRFDTSASKAAAKLAIRRVLLRVSKHLATRLFTYHCAALCEIGQPLKV
jgi:SAM-dependent methyltransferase